jgi:hypothetical protein
MARSLKLNHLVIDLAVAISCRPLRPGDELKLQFEAVSRLDPEEKKVIRSLLDSMILRHEARRWSGTG